MYYFFLRFRVNIDTLCFLKSYRTQQGAKYKLLYFCCIISLIFLLYSWWITYYLFKLFLERVTHVLQKIFQFPNERFKFSKIENLKKKKCCLSKNYYKENKKRINKNRINPCEGMIFKLDHLKCINLGRSFSYVKLWQHCTAGYYCDA